MVYSSSTDLFVLIPPVGRKKVLSSQNEENALRGLLSKLI
jgi:hypothetical protein